MRSKFYLGILATGLSLTAVAAGCGDDVASDDDGTGGTGATGANVGGTGNTGNQGGTGNEGGSASGGMGGSGGVPDDGNDSCARAAAFGTGVTDIIDHEDDMDFFTIDLMEGQVLVFEVDAKPNPPDDTFADGYIDSVITLYDDADMIVAVNDDPIPRTTQDSTLYMRAPKTGTYCLSIEDFCHWDSASPGCANQPPLDIGDYTISVGEFDPMATSVTFGLNEPNDTAATAETLKYGTDMATGEYYLSIVHGLFDSGTDVDVYKLTFPTDDPTPLDPNQEWNLEFDLFPAGITGNGSTVQTGNVWLTTEADPVTKLGQVDGTKIDVAFGLTLSADKVVPGSNYLLFIEVANGQMPGSNPFYFLTHAFGGGNPIEAADVTNSLIATPEPLTAQMTTTGMGYFVAGNLDLITDVDHYIIDNLANAGDVFFVTCAGQRMGSGLRGLKVDVTDTTGAMSLFSATETADDNANLGDPSPAAPDPGMYPQLVVKLSAMSQAAGISGTNYNCGMGFAPPP